MFNYSIISIPLLFLIGLGILLLIATAVLAFVFPILNSLKTNNGKEPYYPMSFEFLK